ncbi:MAG: hypothetical protein JW751_00455 [Polyangiaceae bacterium]|nr:hypothetical protein [Polyangiaceae bacterium]
MLIEMRGLAGALGTTALAGTVLCGAPGCVVSFESWPLARSEGSGGTAGGNGAAAAGGAERGGVDAGLGAAAAGNGGEVGAGGTGAGSGGAGGRGGAEAGPGVGGGLGGAEAGPGGVGGIGGAEGGFGGAPDAGATSHGAAGGAGGGDAGGTDSAGAAGSSHAGTAGFAGACTADTASDSLNCGACGHPCSTDHASSASCADGLCVPTCSGEYFDCHAPAPPYADDGCECASPRTCEDGFCVGVLDGAEGDWFGLAVAVSADTAVVGAPYDDDRADASGSAYVFARAADTWNMQQKLLARTTENADDGAANDRFGRAVAVSGDTIAVGAPGASTTVVNSGAVYVFASEGEGWGVQQKLYPDPDAESGQDFGDALSLSGSTLVVGAKGEDDDVGAAYVWGRDGETWTVRQRLTPQTPAGAADGHSLDSFGSAVSLSGNLIAVGSRNDSADDESQAGLGSVYVWLRQTGSWAVQEKLRAVLDGGVPDGDEYDQFGTSVSVSGDTIAVGAPNDDDQGDDSGSAYVFVYRDGGWRLQQKLTAQLPDETPDGEPYDAFGYQVALWGDTLLVGAPNDDDGDQDVGTAYLFERTNDTWVAVKKLRAQRSSGAADAVMEDNFGICMAGVEDTVLVGAHRANQPARDSGAAYVFARGAATWSIQQRLLARLPP